MWPYPVASPVPKVLTGPMPLGLLERTWGGTCAACGSLRHGVGVVQEEQLLGILLVPVLITLIGRLAHSAEITGFLRVGLGPI